MCITTVSARSESDVRIAAVSVEQYAVAMLYIERELMDHETVTHLYRDGVDAIIAVTSSFDDASWAAPACGTWDGADTALHVLGVARWYGQWLDRALAGTTSLPFPATEIDQHTNENLEALRGIDGPTATEQFGKTALAYLDRATDNWDLPYSYPYGTATVGLHLGVAATEWHLHAFDLARSIGRVHEPHDAPALFRAAGLCVAATKPALRGAILRRLVALGARYRPWHTILRESGRKVDS